MSEAPNKVLLVWDGNGSIKIIHRQDDVSPRDTSAAYIQYDTHQAEITRLTADLREARMQALSDGAQWQDDVARLTAEREAAVAAALEAAEDACDEYPRVAPDTSEWPHYDDQINHSKANIRNLATDTQRNALAERDRRMKAEGWREAAKAIARRKDGYIEEHGSYDPSTGVTEFPGNGTEYVWELEEIEEELLARADEIERGEG